MTFPFQGPKTRINNVWIIFIDPLILGYRFFLNFILFSPQSLGSFFSICLFLPFLQVPSWLPRNCSVETVHLVPHAASLCIPGLSPPPVGPPQTASGPLLPSGVSLLAGMTSLANLLASVIKSQLLRFMRSDACRRENTYSS